MYTRVWRARFARALSPGPWWALPPRGPCRCPGPCWASLGCWRAPGPAGALLRPWSGPWPSRGLSLGPGPCRGPSL